MKPLFILQTSVLSGRGEHQRTGFTQRKLGKVNHLEVLANQDQHRSGRHLGSPEE
jgi:hypothetical protein